jgi:hypothetical protein
MLCAREGCAIGHGAIRPAGPTGQDGHQSWARHEAMPSVSADSPCHGAQSPRTAEARGPGHPGPTVSPCAPASALHLSELAGLTGPGSFPKASGSPGRTRRKRRPDGARGAPRAPAPRPARLTPLSCPPPGRRDPGTRHARQGPSRPLSPPPPPPPVSAGPRSGRDKGPEPHSAPARRGPSFCRPTDQRNARPGRRAGPESPPRVSAATRWPARSGERGGRRGAGRGGPHLPGPAGTRAAPGEQPSSSRRRSPRDAEGRDLEPCSPAPGETALGSHWSAGL